MAGSEPECRRISRAILPAVRASIAEIMYSRYRWRQQRIADGLGVAQVAISKYLNGRYSKEVLKMKNYIRDNGLGNEIAKRLAQGRDKSEVHSRIDGLCTEIIQRGVA